MFQALQVYTRHGLAWPFQSARTNSDGLRTWTSDLITNMKNAIMFWLVLIGGGGSGGLATAGEALEGDNDYFGAVWCV